MAYSPACQQRANPVMPTLPQWKFELILALALLAVGLLLVPLVLYWAGGAVAGEYAGERGVWDLLLHVWGDAGRGRISAWILFLTPYLAVQLLRLSIALLRRPAVVTDLTDIEIDQ